MTVSLLAEHLGAKIITGSPEALAREVDGGYCGDLLSWVMGRCEPSSAWVTIMSNANVAAVAQLTDAACVVLSEGVEPDGNLLAKAEKEDIVLMGTQMASYEACWRIHEAGL